MRIEISEVKAKAYVKMARVHFDQNLSFNAHIDELCQNE